MNGTADSIIIAELSNWNGMAVKIPRAEVLSYNGDEISGAGVYFLFCQDDGGRNSVYIGESEDVFERLRQHLKDYQSGNETFCWNTVVAFTGHDLNKALIRYLEDKLVKDARECGRYHVLTKNTYGKTVMKQSEKAVMAEFMDNVKLIISTMSYNVFEPVAVEADNTLYFFCRNEKSGADAKGFVSPGGFTVLKGSIISANVVGSLITPPHKNYTLRLKLEDDGIISGRKFQSDYEFTSPSAAASVVMGFNASGNHYWRTDDGTRLKDIQR